MNRFKKTLLRALAAVAIVAALPATNALATNTARIGDTVWNDTNGNGVQDSGEPGLPGVLVRLLNCQKIPLGSATTNLTGNYRFSALPAGCYIIAVDFPPGYDFSPQNQGGDDAKDSDVNQNTGETGPINLAVGQIDLTQDAGVFTKVLPPKSAIGDFVFNDTDGDGVQDSGELGVPGVPVELEDCNGNFLTDDVTDASGFYQFAPLAAGCYVVRFIPNSNQVFSPQDQGGDGTRDSDPNPSTGRTGQINLGQAENNPNIDAGILADLPPKSAIGDFVWRDTNNNGIQDFGELGVPNVPVELFDCNGNSLTDDVTDASGFYQFAPLAAGCYVVKFTPPPGTSLCAAGQGSDRTRDSDASPSTGRTGQINLGQAENNPNIDAGICTGTPPTPTPTPTSPPQLARLGDRVFNDLDRDGVQDGIEPGVPDVVVMLQDCSGNTLSTKTTDGGGYYLFANLNPGCYVVMFNAPPGTVFSPQDQGGNETTDSDANPSTGKTAPVNLGSGENNPNVDAGVYTPVVPPTPTPTPLPLRGSLGDKVFNDLDRDGVQDGNEPGVPDVVVMLQDCSGNTLATKTTDSNGNYSFTGLNAGCYVVMFNAPSGTVISSKDQGGNDATDSDPNPSTGKTDPINLAAGENNPTVDAGVSTPPPVLGSLGDKVFNDLDADGIQDANEPGIGGIEVALLDCNGSRLATDITDGSGVYGFGNLAAGCYRVRFVDIPGTFAPSPADQGGDDSRDSDSTQFFSVTPGIYTGETEDINLGAGENNPTIDQGLYRPAQLGDKVFRDTDNDGIQDTGEPGVPDVVVMLQDCSGNTLQTKNTDANGIYNFFNLAPGCYVVMFNAPSGTVFSPVDQGSNNAVDSDANPNTGKTGPVNLVAGENNPTVDAGITTPATCGLAVNKTCSVPAAPPSSNFVCRDTKPITEITMIWNGTAPVNVSTDAGQTFTNVQPGDRVTARTNGANDQIWTLTGGATGRSTFHVSCSDPDMTVPADCGKAAGDGKGLSGFVNTWVFDGMAGANGRLTCTAPTTEFTESCNVALTSPTPICDGKTKPTSLVFRYTGGGCSASNNPQGGKATCTGSVTGGQAVTIRAGKKGKNGAIDTAYVVTPATVQPGQTFEVTGPFAADSAFILSNAGGTQTLGIHTSCSQPINPGDIYGGLTLVGKNGATGSASVTYQYEVRNTGDALTNVTMVDDKLGSVTSAFSLLPGEVRSFTKSASINTTTTNRVDVQGTLNAGGSNSQTCTANDSVTVTVR